MDGESNISKTESNLDPSFPPQDDPSSSSSSSTPFSAPPPRPLDPSSSATTDVSMEDVLQGEAELDVGSVDGLRQTVSGEERVRTELTKENEDTSTSNSQNPLFNHQPSTSEQTNSLSERPTLPFNPFTVEKTQEMDVEAVEGSSSSNHLPPPPPPPAGLSSFPSPSASFPPSHPSSNTPGATFNPQLPFNASSFTLPEPEQPVASTSSLPPPTTAFSRPSRTATSVSAAAASHRRAARGVSKPEPEPEPEPPSEVTLTLAQKRKLVSRKQEEITRVMSRHDDLVRQAFHMEKFVDMVSFDPVIAKQDFSAVFLQWSEPYNLLANLAAASGASGNESPGGSSKPIRTTRRQITERKEFLAVDPSPLNKGKGKARATYGSSFPFDDLDDLPSPSSKSSSSRKGGRKSHLGSYPPGSDAMLPPPFPKSSYKKRPTSSLAYDTDDDGPPTPPPKKLKYLAFDPPSYTHIDHIPSKPHHDFSLTRYLSSITFLTADDLPIVTTHPQGTPSFLEKQARKEAILQNKIASLQALGRLGSVANTMGGARRAPPGERKTEMSRHEAMLEHLPFVQRGVLGEGKAKVAGAKKVGKLIVGYWEREGGREERERKDEERARKVGARALGKMIRGKWRLAVNAVRAKLKEEEQRERERLGKEHLDAMLERSGGLLDRRREDLVGVGLEREGEDKGDSVDGRSADSGSRSGSASGSDQEEEEEEGSEEEKEAGSSDEEADEEDVNGHSRSRTSSSPFVANPSEAARSPSAPLDLEEAKEIDVEFNPTSVEVTAEEDELLELEMEAAEDEEPEDDSEDEGLLNDADLPIEELMARYGYGAPGDGGAVDSDDESEEEDDEGEDEEGDEAEEEEEEDEDDVIVLADAEEEDETVPATPPAVEAFSPEPASIQELEPTAEDVEEQPRSDQMDVDDEQASSRNSDSSEEDSDSDEDEDGMEVTRSNALVDDEDDPDHPEGAPPKIRTPFLFRGNLRPYQQAGLEWLASLYNNETNGILADEMGLGKTIQTISLLSYLACEKGMWGPHLIVVPTSVILNWEMEFKKFFPGFKVMTYYGNQRDRKEKRRGWNTENAFNVCITSYQLVLADQHIFRRKPWHYLILDEAHNVKNFRSQRWQTLLGFNAQRRLLLTGTPLQNNLMELWSLLYFLMPAGMQAEGTGFANHKEFSEWFSNPMDKAIESGGQMSDEAKATITRLHTLLRPYLLRRLKADVEKQLPGKFEHVVYCRLAKRQRFLYDEFMSRSQTRETLTSGNFLSIANCLMQLRKVCNHPDLFEVRPIVTSFAMPKSVAAEFEIKELFVRRKLLAEDDSEKLDLDVLNLTFTNHETTSKHASRARNRLDGSHLLPLVSEITSRSARDPPSDTTTIAGWKRFREHQLYVEKVERWKHIAYLNQLRCQQTPVYGDHLISLVSELGQQPHLVPLDIAEQDRRGYFDRVDGINALVKSNVQRAEETSELITKFAVIPPNAVAGDLVRHALPTLNPSHPALSDPSFDSLHHSAVAHQIAFPDASLLQYDCGKLQKLFDLLRERKAGGHRVLIFTQMTKVLDILEIFLNHHGHRYLRLDGSTKIEDRQIITERFNTDDRIFCFIASSRSGGVGINLTGADTVLFFDSDWNPALDKQCQDRAHRIGQTREVHIYRFVSEHTIEENMLKKANQKRMLDNVVIQEGEFTTDYFGKMDWRDMLGDDLLGTVERGSQSANAALASAGPQSARQMERDMALAEDEDDRVAGEAAMEELEVDRDDFIEVAAAPPAVVEAVEPVVVEPSAAVGGGEGGDVEMGAPEGEEIEAGAGGDAAVEVEQQPEEEEEEEIGAVDDYMVKWVETDWEYFG
ncbi:SNF2 family N-terminal domain-containing protein [Mrakia frigida]|uniref:chromatin-remodeling protein SWR1 n=1 Tax=Mrakia frigida TaxID=29902 RepID=UPI003FCC10A1